MSIKKIEFIDSYPHSICFADKLIKDLEILSDFQTAFLDILKDKYLVLYNGFKNLLIEEAKPFFYSEHEDSDEFNAYEVLYVHRYILPSEEDEDNKWQIIYGMEDEYAIFHIYFNGWEFDYIGVTA